MPFINLRLAYYYIKLFCLLIFSNIWTTLSSLKTSSKFLFPQLNFYLLTVHISNLNHAHPILSLELHSFVYITLYLLVPYSSMRQTRVSLLFCTWPYKVVNPRTVGLRFVVNKVALGKFDCQYYGCPLSVSFHQCSWLPVLRLSPVSTISPMLLTASTTAVPCQYHFTNAPDCQCYGCPLSVP